MQVPPPLPTQAPPLPPGWVLAQDPQGRPYYANPSTGESSWTPVLPSVNMVPIPSIPPPPPMKQPTFTPSLNASGLVVPSAKALLAKHESQSNVPIELTLTGGMIADLVSIQKEKEGKEVYQEIDVEKMSPTSYIEPMVESRLEARMLGLKDALRKIQ
ncbi:predicted protein [Chaetoceros tenuissimus]|uniref:WW domain-containing protein n=1 Tax=Chaetoceros tenuissimus TaxID=426638 RepID=A0AAD3CME2_9STRA|nr:predicted protein [Chaetoceros tenuissimus]